MTMAGRYCCADCVYISPDRDDRNRNLFRCLQLGNYVDPTVYSSLLPVGDNCPEFLHRAEDDKA